MNNTPTAFQILQAKILRSRRTSKCEGIAASFVPTAGAVIASTMLVASQAHAACLVNGTTPSNNGTSGDDILLCDVANDPAGADVNGGDGNDGITINGGTAGGVRGGNGDDIIDLNGGTADQVNGQSGNDTINLTGGNIVEINGAGGLDTINLTGGQVGVVFAGRDDDVITLDGSTVDTFIAGRDDDDTFFWISGDITGVPIPAADPSIGTGFIGGEGADTAVISTDSFDGTYHLIDGDDFYSIRDAVIPDPLNDKDNLTLGGAVSGDINGVNLLNWEIINLDAVEVRIADGALEVGPDNSDGLFLINGAVLDQSGTNLTLTGNMSVDANSTFIGTGGGSGSHVISGNLANSGTVTTQDGVVGDAITVTGDHSGMGQLLLDIDTAMDAADTMTVAGDSSGMTGIVVNNLSPNAATGNDILLVSVAGSSADGDFTLVGGPVLAGAFQYGLEYQAGDFVLAAMLSSTGGVYEAAPHVLLYGLARMPTLEQRVGQRRWNSGGGTPMLTSGVWLRMDGDQFETRLDTGTSYDADKWGLQAGFDLPVEAGVNGQWIFGLTAQTGGTSASIATAMGTGSLSSESLGIGATATWYGHDDLYVDLQAQLNWANVAYGSSLNGKLAEDVMGQSTAASIEVGQRFALDIYRGLIPQAQLVWSQVDGELFTDSAGNTVDIGTNRRVTGRLGLAYDYEWRDAGEESTKNVYGIVNLLHDFSSDASVIVAGTSLGSDREGTWAEIGFGGSMTWNDSTTLYGEASYREALGSGPGGSGIAATAGLRIQW